MKTDFNLGDKLSIVYMHTITLGGSYNNSKDYRLYESVILSKIEEKTVIEKSFQSKTIRYVLLNGYELIVTNRKHIDKLYSKGFNTLSFYMNNRNYHVVSVNGNL